LDWCAGRRLGLAATSGQTGCVRHDGGKAKDKQRLADKKAKKAVARAERQEAKAVVEDPSRSPEASALEHDLKTLRGDNRRRAWKALLALDRRHAISVVEAMAKDAAGKNLSELGCLLVTDGEDRHVDAAVAGRYGEVAVAGVAPAVCDAAVIRLRQHLLQLPSAPLSASELGRRLACLGAAPFVAGAARPAVVAALLCAILDDKRSFAADVFEHVINGLLDTDPAALWVRRHAVSTALGERDPRFTMAGLSQGALGAGALAAGARAIDDLVDWLMALEPAARSRRLAGAGLPASARFLDPRQQALLWRAVFLDELATPARRQTAARNLWDLAGHDAASDAVHTILLHPLVNTEVTAEVCGQLQFEECWPELSPHALNSAALRDSLLATSHSRHPDVMPMLRALLAMAVDAVSVGAWFARNEHPDATDELLGAIDAAATAGADDVVRGLVGGAISPGPSTTWRDLVNEGALRSLLSRTDGGVDISVGVLVLRRFQPVAGSLRDDVDRAVERIVRRFTLAR
jgi:hypothetical protein